MGANPRIWTLPSSALAISNGRLFPSLKSLHLTGCCKVTSRMALDALLQCLQLEDFRVPRISVTNLKLTPQPWVCHGLKIPSVFFASDPVDPSADSLVFQQLSRLQWLESLDVSQQHEWFESIGVSQHHDSDMIWSPPYRVDCSADCEIETGFGT